MREVTIERNTNETQIELTLNLDGAGRYQVDTGCGFLNHMLAVSYTHLDVYKRQPQERRAGAAGLRKRNCGEPLHRKTLCSGSFFALPSSQSGLS